MNDRSCTTGASGVVDLAIKTENSLITFSAVCLFSLLVPIRLHIDTIEKVSHTYVDTPNQKTSPKKIKMDRKIRTVAVVMALDFLRFFSRTPSRI